MKLRPERHVDPFRKKEWRKELDFHQNENKIKKLQTD